MTNRQRLIELIEQAERKEKYDFLTADLDEAIDMSGGTKISCSMEYLADYLLEHGVIVPPCKVGDMVFMLQKIRKGHWEEDKYIVDDRVQWKIYEKKFSLYHIPDVGKTVFLTREEAEQAVKGA